MDVLEFQMQTLFPWLAPFPYPESLRWGIPICKSQCVFIWMNPGNPDTSRSIWETWETLQFASPELSGDEKHLLSSFQ